jgi:hypothetical protein
MKALGGSMAVLAIVTAALVMVVAGAGRVLAVSADHHKPARSLIGYAAPASGLQWFAEPDFGMVPRTSAGVALAALSPVALPLSDGANARDESDPLHTGSLGRAASYFAATDAPLAGTFRLAALPPPPEEDIEPAPLPRARPKLASLPPAADMPLDDEALMARTAIYDIAAKVVYMPNGEKLEAHSGYGEYMDDIRHVRLRMRGVTPPNTYKLHLREALFHGEQTLRMTPIGNGNMHGRNGFLVHSYLLGPSGQSNGCVSVKDYPKFLAAFMRGEVNRIVVVDKLPSPPGLFARHGWRSAAAAVSATHR